jgi:hypothetical protein
LLLCFLLHVQPNLAFNESVIPWIAGVPPSATCQESEYTRPCIYNGNSITNYPPLDFPCPCSQGDTGGAYPATGQPFGDPPQIQNFVDELFFKSSLPKFTNLVGMDFADSGEIFIHTKAVSRLM